MAAATAAAALSFFRYARTNNHRGDRPRLQGRAGPGGELSLSCLLANRMLLDRDLCEVCATTGRRGEDLRLPTSRFTIILGELLERLQRGLLGRGLPLLPSLYLEACRHCRAGGSLEGDRLLHGGLFASTEAGERLSRTASDMSLCLRRIPLGGLSVRARLSPASRRGGVGLLRNSASRGRLRIAGELDRLLTGDSVGEFRRRSGRCGSPWLASGCLRLRCFSFPRF
mmetsp:Transcript_135070/g.263047  ORF Transcript_135070/g.263047 Transcript_135070/m.263047 type:complete len:227 (-) Transcript_135070:1175-1855(-)